MLRIGRVRTAAAALVFGVLAASATYAQTVPHLVANPRHSLPVPARTPLTVPTLIPGQAPSAGAGRVPLSALPPLPAKTSANSAYFGPSGIGRRPMAATGVTINYFADISNANCGSVVGTLIPVGCDVYWQSQNLTGTDKWQDYFVDAGSTTATPVGVQYIGGSGIQHNTGNLTTVGTYVLATLDATTNKWVSVVYVSVGSVNVFGTYADSGATVPQQQFTAANGTNVYVNASGLTQGQSYVVYIESTSVNPTCTYIAPPGTVTANTLCDPTTSPGITAVVGAQNSAAITAVWPLSSTTPTGTYSVVLYNLTTHTRLAMRQVSITGSSATGSFSVIPVNGNAALPANWPTPPPSPYAAAVKFAFDSTAEQSDKGFNATASGLAKSTNYSFTMTDPTGFVVFGPQTNGSGTGGTITKNVNFSNTQSPSNYIGNVYTLQMYNQSTKAVDASQAIQIVGYNAITQFQDPNTGAISTSVVLTAGTSVVKTLQFVNNGDTLYGTGNGDTLRGFAFNTGANGIWINLTDPTVVTACGGACQQQSVTDTNGVAWTIQNTCYGGNGANKGCTLTAYPSVAGTVLAMNATIPIPNVQFNNVPGNSGCQNGCSGLTSILPTDGVTWSNTNGTAANPVYFTNGFSNQYTGTASVSHYGYRDNANNLYTGYETHGYAPNTAHAIYTSQSPYTSTSGFSEVWSVTATNNATAGTANITQLEILLPTAYSPGGTRTNVAVDASSPTSWQTIACPAGSPGSAFCIQKAGGNTGITPAGGSQTIYIDLAPPPPGAFSYTDWTISAINPTNFPLTPSGSFTGFVPSTLSYDSTATASYSLNGNLITPGFAPTTEGQNTNNSVTIDVTNASTAQDPFPDYLDLITIDLPSANAFASLSGMPAGWSLLGPPTTPAAGVSRYWFGLCAGQLIPADGPPANPPPVNPTIPSCGAGTEASSIAPGQTFSVTGNLQTGTSNITGTMYAHGANVAGWSAAHTFTLNVTAVSASAGFSAAGGYPTGSAVNSPNTPQIGADADVTNGNAFSYVIKNTSGTGQYITSAVITIPGLDTSAVLPADGSAWTLTNTPSISGTAYGCSVTGSASANRTGANNGYGAYNGGITIGGAGCSIPPGSALTITFTAKAPYTVNDTYQFPTKVNGSANASEQWSTDTIVQVVLAASLSIAVNPANPGPGGSTPVVSCVPCVFNAGTSTVDFGLINNLQTVAGGDVVRVSVYTNAGSTVGWKLYVSTNLNPANTGTPANELLTSIDSTHSAPTAGINFDQAAYAIVPTTNPGMLLMDTGSGHAAQRTPFDELMNFEISIQGGPVTPQTATVTYTFISN
jgi:hypothetical protein